MTNTFHAEMNINFHNVVCTVRIYQVIVCKLVQHCAHTYTVKLNSDMFRWRPPNHHQWR